MKMFKKVLVAVLAATMVLAMALPVSAAKVSYFSDVAEDAWYYEAVTRWAEEGVLKGYDVAGSEKEFHPEDNIKRSELTALVCRVLACEYDEAFGNPFTDVKEADWFYTEVLAAAADELVNGYPDSTFRPENEITRQEAMTVLGRATVEPHTDAGCLTGFDDVEEIGSWAGGYICALVDMGVVLGDDQDMDGKMEIRPEDPITRAEVAALLHRLFPVEDKEVTLKIYGKATAGEVSVESKVYSDYSAEVTITNGVASFEEIKAEVELIEVPYAGSRQWSKSLTTDVEMKVTATDVVPSLYLFGEDELVLGEVECGSVTVNVDDVTAVYNVYGETLTSVEEIEVFADIDGVFYKAVPQDEDAVRAVVEEVRAHVAYASEGSDNAGTIKNGSYMTWGGKGVAFGVNGNDFVLDGVGTDLAAVKSYVANNISEFPVENPVANQVEIKLVAGSVVTVMGRSLLLEDDCVITIKAAALNTGNFDELLDAYQNGTQEEVAAAALGLVDELVAMTKTDDIVVNVAF